MACRFCTAELYPTPAEKASPAFFSVYEPDYNPDAYNIQPYLNDQPVRWAFECLAGEQGWVLMAVQPVTMCECGEDAESYRLTGNVRVERVIHRLTFPAN